MSLDLWDILADLDCFRSWWGCQSMDLWWTWAYGGESTAAERQ